MSFPGLQASGRKTVSAILPPGNGCATQCWQCLPWPSLRACAFMQSPHCSNRTALTDASLPISSLPSISGGNNLLAYLAERADSYAFYETEVWMKSLPTFIIASLTFVVLIILAWRGGRTYCNTICQVGTVLGFLSGYSLFKPVIDTEKCNAADFAHATARHRASTPKPTKLITPLRGVHGLPG